MNSLPRAIIREARLEDAGEIARVHVHTWQHAYKEIMPQVVLDQLSIERWTEDWIQRLQPSVGTTFVLEIDDVIQGWASIGPSRDGDAKNDSGELCGIYLNPVYWGKGLGTSIYLRVENAMRSAGFTESRLWVFQANERARRFYENAGYRPDEYVKTIQREGVVLKEIRYIKDIFR